MDPQAHLALTLEVARSTAAAGDLHTALAIAEEVLDLHPDDLDALLMVAELAPRVGLAASAVAAVDQAAARGARPGAVAAAALFAAGRLEDAVAEADRRLADAPDDARAHAVRGQALELLGRAAEADEALARAARLAPSRFALGPPLAEAAWDPLLLAARSGLDPSDRAALRDVAVRFVDLPDLDDLRAVAAPWPPPSPAVDGLYDVRRPDEPVLWLFRRNLARGASDADAVVERLRDRLLEAAERRRETRDRR